MGWQLNADAAILFGSGSLSTPAAGRRGSIPMAADTDTGYNLFFGIATSSASYKPFLEFRWTFINDTSPFRLMLGFSLPL